MKSRWSEAGAIDDGTALWMPDHASGVMPVTCSCQPSARVPGAPNGNGCWRAPGPVRGAGVGVGAGAMSVSGVGAGAEAALGSTNVMGVGLGFAAVVAGAAGTGRLPSAGGSGGGATAMLVAAMAAPEASPTATVYVPTARAGR